MSTGSDWSVGDWCRHTRHTTRCRIIDRQSIWNETVFRVWLPTKDAIIRARDSDLAPLASLKQPIGRIGLSAVRAYRRRRLEQEHRERMATLDAAETSLPDLNAIMMLRVGPGFASESSAAAGA
ncbi:MAG: hypothetical protein EA400_00865 [Chromatiaceae bacterium]|nr:MAG: hypothetical protein EA400_00865 [Chromatiaceae bacterium]